MADLSNIESAWLRATARFEKWRGEFDKKFYAPASDTMLNMITSQLQQLPPEVQQMSRQINPQAWREFDRMTAERKNKEVKYGI